MKPIATALKFQLVAFCSAHKQSEEKKIKGNCIIVSTPGRFANLIEKMPEVKNYVKSLEILVIDEADRFIDVDLKTATTSILSILPKQRRTGLFSATQAKEMEDLIKFGLRNPVRLEVTGDSDTLVDAKTNSENKTAAPSTLENSFVVIPAAYKVHALVEILKRNAEKKVLVFFSSRFSVIYFERVIKLMMGDKRKIINTHGKKFNRTKAIQEFSKSKNPIMLATDVAGRGLDLENVDIVIQFDLPKYSSWFVHRIGRAGRIGKAGASILLLTPEEEAYAEFLENHENIKLTKSDHLDDIAEKDVEKTRNKIVKLASTEREFLELGTNAFVAMINAYLSHDCQIVCKVWDLDIGNLANAFGLVRMPKISEIKKVDISNFQRVDIETSSIPYKNQENEAVRQEKLAGQEGRRPRFQTKGKRRKHRSDKDTMTNLDGEENVEDEKAKPQKRRKMNEWEELQTEQRLLKNFKKGKLSKDQLNDAMDEI
uniref:ATP-dependent RNA helicase n=1 Tax=Panagrolaimus sp. ES5 TaxID=591445 RepID=A0AC34FAP8_9BILA